MKECREDEADKVIITVLHNAPETDENVCVQFDELEEQSKGASISFVTLTDGKDFATDNIFRSCTSENFIRNFQTLYKLTIEYFLVTVFVTEYLLQACCS